VTARSKLSVCGCLLVGIAGSNPAAALMFVCCACLVSLGRDLFERADHSFRRVLTSVVCRNGCDRETLIVKRPGQMGAVASWAGNVSHNVDYQ